MSSWRKSTKRQYTAYINKWNMYCSENKVQVSSPVVCDVINFLDKIFSEGLTYYVLNTARSAISFSICLQNSEFSVENHPIISRFMRGAFNIRLALPRYVNTSDNMGHAGDTVTFVINQLIKQKRPGFHVKYDVDLCVVIKP
ncbi:hypothetical protein MAR_018331, partial [Mya arenaria]